MKQVLVALDQTLNALIGGWADETISARAHRNSGKSRRWARARKVIDGIFFWQKNHCRAAYDSEATRRHLPPEYRDLQSSHAQT